MRRGKDVVLGIKRQEPKVRRNRFLEGGWLPKFLRCPRDLRLGPLLCKIFLNDLEKGVNNVLITFVVDKELLGAVQPTANCEEIQKVLTFLSYRMIIK